mgnify:CR=1 FL=1
MAEMMTQKKSNRPSDFIDALITLQKECKVHSIKLSEFGIQSEDFPKFLQNARDTNGRTVHSRPTPDYRRRNPDISLKILINNG